MDSLTQGGASLALGYFLSGFQPFQFEPPYVGCYVVKSFSTFAVTAASILMNGATGRLQPSPGSFFIASMPGSLPAIPGMSRSQ